MLQNRYGDKRFVALRTSRDHTTAERSGLVDLDAYVRSVFFGEATIVNHVTQVVAGTLYASSSVCDETLNFLPVLSQLLFVVRKNLFLPCASSRVAHYTFPFWFAA